MKKIKTNKPLKAKDAWELHRYIKKQTNLDPNQYSLGIGCTEHYIPGETFKEVQRFLSTLGYTYMMPLRNDGKKRIQKEHKKLVASSEKDEEINKLLTEIAERNKQMDEEIDKFLNELLKEEARKPHKETNKDSKHLYELMEADLPIKENKFITIKIDRTKFTKDQLELLFAMIDGANRLGKTNE